MPKKAHSRLLRKNETPAFAGVSWLLTVLGSNQWDPARRATSYLPPLFIFAT
jgi:hypothetical protein